MKRTCLCLLLLLALINVLIGCDQKQLMDSAYVVKTYSVPFDLDSNGKVYVLTDTADLNALVNQRIENNELNDKMERFKQAMQIYDDRFFEENALIWAMVDDNISSKFLVKEINVTEDQGVVTFLKVTPEFEELLEDTFALIVEIPRNLAVKNYRAEFEHMIAEQQVYDELPGTEFGYKKRMEKPVG